MKSEKKAHFIMTQEEYSKFKIIGWHEVCKNYDGCGGLGVRFFGLKKTKVQDAEKEPHKSLED